jgi:hypothetical protein
MSGKPAIADDPPWWRRQFPDEAGRERHLVRLARRHSENDGPPLAIGDHERLLSQSRHMSGQVPHDHREKVQRLTDPSIIYSGHGLR